MLIRPKPVVVARQRVRSFQRAVQREEPRNLVLPECQAVVILLLEDRLFTKHAIKQAVVVGRQHAGPGQPGQRVMGGGGIEGAVVEGVPDCLLQGVALLAVDHGIEKVQGVIAVVGRVFVACRRDLPGQGHPQRQAPVAAILRRREVGKSGAHKQGQMAVAQLLRYAGGVVLW